jgi:predicted FMN-binding regulatory protein PaiB
MPAFPDLTADRADSRYAAPDTRAEARIVVENPLAWIVSASPEDFCATLVPLRPQIDATGQVTALIGHFARSNPHVAALSRNPAALVLLLGPHSYVSPSWMRDRTQAPTWNYASAQFLVEVELRNEPAQLDAALDDLIGSLERDRPNAWSSRDMGTRYEKLSRGIVAFHARIASRRTRFKLGQDERDDVFADIMTALRDGRAATPRDSGTTGIADWMSLANPGRATSSY